MAKKVEHSPAPEMQAHGDSTTAIEVVKPAEIQAASELSGMFAEDAGAGLNNMGAGDFAIPFITILQKGSPQVSKANAKYIKGAEQGMIMNTVTQEVYDGDVGILLIPCGYDKTVVRWKSRDSGGGLVAHYKEGDPFLATCKRNDRGQLVHEESGDILVDTAYHFGLLIPDSGFPEWSVVSMYSTQLKKSRMWNTVMRRIMKRGPQGVFNPPSYSHKYRLTTVGETKDTYDWWGWKIVSEGEVDDVETYKMARDFASQVKNGNVRVSAPPQDFDVEVSEEAPF